MVDPACDEGAAYMTGPLRISDAAYEVAFDPGAEGGCGGCVAWTLDGVEQPDPFCLLDYLNSTEDPP